MSKSQTEANKRQRTTEEIETLNTLIAYLNNSANWKTTKTSIEVFPQTQDQQVNEAQSLITPTSEAPTEEQKKITFSELEVYAEEFIKKDTRLPGIVAGLGVGVILGAVGVIMAANLVSGSAVAMLVGLLLVSCLIGALISPMTNLFSKKHKETAENTKSTQSYLLKFFDAHPEQKENKEDAVLESIDKYAAVSDL